MVRDLDVARWRLRTQQLIEPHAATAAEVVGALLAVQAENPSQSAWAVAARTGAPDPKDLAGLLADGTVVRTHVLRPTWHYVAADDIAWLIELTAPRVRRTVQPQLRTLHGMDDPAVDRASSVVLDALRRADLTRTDLTAVLADEGCEVEPPRVDDPSRRARTADTVCSGARPRTARTPTPCSPIGSHRRAVSTATRRSPSWPCATSPDTARRPSATSPTGPPSRSVTCARGWLRRLIGSTRSSTTGARSGTRLPIRPQPAVPQLATCCRSSTRRTAGTRTPDGCWTPQASCRGHVRRRPAWPLSTPSSWRR